MPLQREDALWQDLSECLWFDPPSDKLLVPCHNSEHTANSRRPDGGADVRELIKI